MNKELNDLMGSMGKVIINAIQIGMSNDADTIKKHCDEIKKERSQFL